MESADAALSSSLAVRVGPENIRSLILEKEKELHDINEYRIRTLETLLRDKVRRDVMGFMDFLAWVFL